MENKKIFSHSGNLDFNKVFFVLLFLLLLTLSFSSIVSAEQITALETDDDIQFAGFELEKLLNLGSGLLALALFVITAITYNRTKNKRLTYVSIAFLLFAVKGFLMSHELFFTELAWIEPSASALNFAIIFCFFVGVVKK